MAISAALLMSELVMSAGRLIDAAHSAVPREGEWSPQVVLGHLARNDRENWSPRIALMVNAHRLGEPAPAFAWFEPDGEATAAEFGQLTIEEAAAALLAARGAVAGQLRALGPDDWAATATHEVFGEMTLEDVLIRLLAHDEEHRGGLVLKPDVS